MFTNSYIMLQNIFTYFYTDKNSPNSLGGGWLNSKNGGKKSHRKIWNEGFNNIGGFSFRIYIRGKESQTRKTEFWSKTFSCNRFSLKIKWKEKQDWYHMNMQKSNEPVKLLHNIEEISFAKIFSIEASSLEYLKNQWKRKKTWMKSLTGKYTLRKCYYANSLVAWNDFYPRGNRGRAAHRLHRTLHFFIRCKL